MDGTAIAANWARAALAALCLSAAAAIPAARAEVLVSGVQVAQESDEAPANGGQPTAEKEAEPGPIDYNAIAAQMRRLGEMLRQLGETAAESARSMGRKRAQPEQGAATIPPSVSMEDIPSLYGPEGPTERSVKALLEHRLVIYGNPRLKAGEVKAMAKGIVADVVTVKEGALVERYVIDRKTGVWTPER